MSEPKGWRQLGDLIARHGMEREHILRVLQRLPDFHLSSQEVDAILKHVQYRGGPSQRYIFGTRASRCWEAIEQDLDQIPPQIPTHIPTQSAQQLLSTPSRGLADGEPGDGPASVPQHVGKPERSQ